MVTRQYDFNSDDYTNYYISHFMWCNSTTKASKQTYDSSWDGQNTFFANDSGFKVNGFTEAGTCFALSNDEWSHLLTGRESSTVNGTENARYFKGCINKEDGKSMNGLFIFPDAFTWPASVKTQPSGINEASTGYTNTYTYNDFKRLQDAGIVFLPAAGYRYGNLGDKVVSNAGIRGHYWSASSRDDENGYNLFFSSLDVRPDDFVFRYYANAVRLVTKVTDIIE